MCTLEKYEVVSLPNIEIGFGINALPCKWNKLESGLHENFILCSCTWSSNVGIQVFVWIVCELVGLEQSNHALVWWSWLDPYQIHVWSNKIATIIAIQGTFIACSCDELTIIDNGF